MGKNKGLYSEEFSVGSRVRIDDKQALERFLRRWKYHHALQLEQLSYAGQTAVVKSVMFYHGGDELYELVNIPGIWHEECLSAQEETE
ncbi:MAG: hypothetical protein DYH05_06270 [Acidobacteria bacterium ACB1]|nr:hypothetical protein [Pyrinomonadaceae bacterium]MCE7962090.1 hypothetical protein [Acidobacteria bacterium ACB1]RIJ95429.1 MAG: hypothetical protein DCC44_02265 [Acidobacteriota bacterium]